MDNPNNTPTPPGTEPTPPVAPPKDTLKDTLFRTLQLSVDTPEAPPVHNAPVPDSPERIMSDDPEDYSDGRGTMANIVAHIEKKQKKAETAPVEPKVEPKVETPPVAAVPATPPTEPKVEVPKELPKVKLTQLPPPPTPVPVTPAPFDVSSLDLSGLDADEVHEVKTAAFAEQRYPDKYKGYANHVLGYIRKHKQMVETLKSESQDGDVDENDPKYKAFVKANRPPVKGQERRQLERERTLEEAAAIAEARVSQRYKKVEDELAVMKAAPAVEKSLNDYKSLLKEVMPKGDDPLIEEATSTFGNLAANAANEFLMLSAQLKPYDSRNETHRWLADFIAEQGKMFQASKDPATKRGNKSFIPRAEYNNLPSAERAKHFTFTDEDVMQIIAVNAKAAAEYKINLEREKLEKMGYRRVPATPSNTPPVVRPQVEPELSPRANTSTVVPGTISNGQPSDPFMAWMKK